MTSDVHTEHCCSEHGCKYSDGALCTVETGQKPQSHPCESCEGILPPLNGNTKCINDWNMRHEDWCDSCASNSGRCLGEGCSREHYAVLYTESHRGRQTKFLGVFSSEGAAKQAIAKHTDSESNRLPQARIFDSNYEIFVGNIDNPQWEY